MKKPKKVGSFPIRIKRFFNSLANQEGYIGWPRSEFKKLEDYMLKISKLKRKKTERGSWYTPKDSSDCGYWHRDMSTAPCKCIIISSYPSPTQILLDMKGNFLIDDDYNAHCTNLQYSLKIEKLIKEGKAQTFIHKPGDIYLIDGKTVHRKNPVDKGKPHLCLRWWLS